MDQTRNVACVRSDNRRGAAAEALALIVDDLRARITPAVTLRPRPFTHADTLSATLDAIQHAGAAEVLIVEARALAERLGHRREAFGRPVRFVDPDDADARTDAGCHVAVSAVARACGADALLASLPRRRQGGLILPGVLVVDAFDARRAVIAGTDATAVALVAASVLGGAPTNLAGVRILGDRLDRAQRSSSGPRFRRRRAARAGVTADTGTDLRTSES